MPPLPAPDETILRALEQTRSVGQTARRLRLPEREVQRVALMGFGLGRLDVRLSDY